MYASGIEGVGERGRSLVLYSLLHTSRQKLLQILRVRKIAIQFGFRHLYMMVKDNCSLCGGAQLFTVHS